MSISKRIYNHLADDTSRSLYMNRLMYALSGNNKYIQNMINSLDQKQAVDRLIEDCKSVSNRLIVYGAGNDLELIHTLYPELSFQYLCDKDINKQLSGWRGYKVISPEQLLGEFKDYYIMINSTGYYVEIHDMLIHQGIEEEHIINLGEILGLLYEEQYFDSDIMKPSSNEVFIDGGCFNCHTDQLFVKWCNGKYKKIFAFEPDHNNYRICLEVQNKNQIVNLSLINKGLWDCEETLYFDERANQGSKIDNNSNSVIRIDTTSIDLTVGDEEVTFIKLDVEGAELKALQGARNTILKNHPKLAISIYHKDEDILTIPEYILSLSDDYRFYIRHYQLSANETILYAV